MESLNSRDYSDTIQISNADEYFVASNKKCQTTLTTEEKHDTYN